MARHPCRAPHPPAAAAPRLRWEGSISTHGCPHWCWGHPWEQLWSQPQGGSQALREVPDTPAGWDPPRLHWAQTQRNCLEVQSRCSSAGANTRSQRVPWVRPNRRSEVPGLQARAAGESAYRPGGGTLTFKGAQQRLLPGHGLVPPAWGVPRRRLRRTGTGNGNREREPAPPRERSSPAPRGEPSGSHPPASAAGTDRPTSPYGHKHMYVYTPPHGTSAYTYIRVCVPVQL